MYLNVDLLASCALHQSKVGRSSITEDGTRYLLVIDHLYFTNNDSTQINQTNKMKYLTYLSTNNNQYPVFQCDISINCSINGG